MKLPINALFLSAFTLGSCLPAHAKLGETLESFKIRMGTHFKYKTEVKADPNMYYMFSLITLDQEMKMDPGFAGGLTMTVKDGRVQGESMAFRLGQNVESGKMLATAHILDFVYEAIGKPEPRSQEDKQKEFKNYGLAVGMVFSGQPQSVRYPGYNAKITLSRSDQGDLLVGVTPEEPKTSTTENTLAQPTKAADAKGIKGK